MEGGLFAGAGNSIFSRFHGISRVLANDDVSLTVHKGKFLPWWGRTGAERVHS